MRQNRKYNIVKAIFELDEDAMDTLNANGESAFKVAIRSSNPDIVKLVASKLNLDAELLLLAQENQNYLLNKLTELGIISTEKGSVASVQKWQKSYVKLTISSRKSCKIF